MWKWIWMFLLSLTYNCSAGQKNAKQSLEVTRGAYLQSATDTGIVVRWRTNYLSRSRVWYGTSPKNMSKTVDDLSFNTEHIIKLSGLAPATKYYYAIGNLKDTLQQGPENYFITHPQKNKTGKYRIGIFGDCGYLTANQMKVRDEVVKYLGNNYMNAWLLLGDNAYDDGYDEEFQSNFFNSYQNYFLKKYPFYATPGNHDYHDRDFGAQYAQENQSGTYFKIFSMPINGEAGGVPSHNPSYYSFDIGNVHFISLDSYIIEERKWYMYDTLSPQITWLKKDLAASQGKGWIVLFFHHPPYSKGTHDSDTDDIMKGIRENILSILERYNVDLVLAGHSHVYERSRLMKGYYGDSKSFNAKRFNLSNSSGRNDGSKDAEPYKKQKGEGGIVYVVSGSSAHPSKSRYAFPHPAMYYSNDTDAGAGMLEVAGNQLEFKWICADGVIRDTFTIVKGKK